MRKHVCAIRGCTRPQLARTWCERHYRRWRRHGHPLGGRRYRTGCKVPECTARHSAKGYCAKHYERVKRHGDPLYLHRTEVDDIAVVRAVDGDRAGPLTLAEREEIVRKLHRQGLLDGQIAVHLDIGTSGVWTIRQRIGLPANAAPVGDFSGRVP
ncbi:hypothetical protein DEJ49_33195 [Streptomyces venezuelae]|uniref:Uncharacterized protein n=1 Tax=Streptomyces venezuelae TaxID=54571 RepID=A0A5P2CTY5_STRVZ|nr:hypothetical protein [Streptomyces venezuelae]QES45198.1 hypothetical protein DEJ49_33195 [Streptomyces venezuelae]